jgi:hypothetical protein
MRSLLMLFFGLFGGLFIMWVARQGMKQTSLLRIPRAYTDIFRSTKPSAPVALPASRALQPQGGKVSKRAPAAAKRKADEEDESEAGQEKRREEEEEEVEAAEQAPAKPSRRGTGKGSGSSSAAGKKKKPAAVVEEEEAEEGSAAAAEEEEEEEEVEAKPKRKKGRAPAEEVEEEGEGEEQQPKKGAPAKRAAKGKGGRQEGDAAAAGAPKKISRRFLGKEKGQEPNPEGFVDPKTGKLPGKGASGVEIPPAPAPPPEAPMPRKTIVPAPPRPALKKVFKTEEDIPEFCEGPERFPEEPIEWHIVEEDEVDREAHPCHLANVTHWALKYWYKLGQIKICTHDPKVDEVRGAPGAPTALRCTRHPLPPPSTPPSLYSARMHRRSLPAFAPHPFSR